MERIAHAPLAQRSPDGAKALSPRLQRIVDNLEAILLDEGFLQFRTEDLARRLRCSKQTLYTLAPSREQLFELIVERLFCRIRQQGKTAAEHAVDWVSAVAGYLDVAVQATRGVSAQFVRDLARFDPGRRRLKHHQRLRIAGLEAILAEGVRKGAFGEIHSKLVADFMIHAVARMSDPHVLASCGLTMSQAYAELYRLFIYGLIRGDDSRRSAKPANPPRIATGGISLAKQKSWQNHCRELEAAAQNGFAHYQPRRP
ncbi:MAG: TetR/AcrR family transcriptional regulator [Candidatus Binataceae bacterium]|jgi:AcrR family transcriptional regulator